MDCQHLQQLLPFLSRPSEELDPVEQAAARRHLATCPECNAVAQAESRTDAAIAAVMRDVPVPADLQQKVLSRLSTQRKRFPWKRSVAAVAALVLIGLGVNWFWQPKPVVSLTDLIEFEQRGYGWDEMTVKKFLADEGIDVTLPSKFRYEYLRRMEVVEFMKRRVVKLTFHGDFGNGEQAHAEVLILPHSQFKVDALADIGEVRGATSVQIRREGPFTHVIFVPGQGDLNKLQHQIGL